MENWLIILIFSIILVAHAVFFLAIRIVLKKNGKFPNTHVSGNKALQEKGICCAHSFDRIEQEKARKNVDYKNVTFIKPSN